MPPALVSGEVYRMPVSIDEILRAIDAL